MYYGNVIIYIIHSYNDESNNSLLLLLLLFIIFLCWSFVIKCKRYVRYIVYIYILIL